MAPTFANPGKTVLRPTYLAHVVLKTRPSQFKAMVDFYKIFLNAHASYENEFLSFLTYDEEHHRVAIAALPDIEPPAPKASGLLHICFAFSTLQDLALAYRQRKANGIEPYWCINHGPTTSMYYRDPDGNEVETQVDNFDTVEEATAFFYTPEFAMNPIGTDFDPEDLIKRLESGEDESVIKKRVETGPRTAKDVPRL
jgi:catechol-2,3-dioxygenase